MADSVDIGDDASGTVERGLGSGPFRLGESGVARKTAWVLSAWSAQIAGKHPSVASVYRALAEAEQAELDAPADDDLPRRPVRVRIRRPGEPLTAEETELRERLVAQRAELDAAELEEVGQ
ncbi:hypothetical protein GCM10020000_78270 [Streptomyces olivoverticillatus]